MRARTSSERLLSWVEVASIVCGHLAARSALAPWNADDRHAEVVRIAADVVQRHEAVVDVEAVSSTPFAVTGAVNCWKRIANARYSAAQRLGARRRGARASSGVRTKSKTLASAARLRRCAWPTAQSM